MAIFIRTYTIFILALLVLLIKWVASLEVEHHADDKMDIHSHGHLHPHHKSPHHFNGTDPNRHKKHTRHPPCGGPHHASLTRPCSNNDTLCGSWNDRWWNPTGCTYRDITPEDARQCVGGRTIACLGDSQVRDVCVAIAILLMGVNATMETARTGKFDYEELDDFATMIPDYPFWYKNVPPHNHNGYSVPQREVGEKNDFRFQMQMWSLFRNEFIMDQAQDVLSNRMVNASADIRPIDFVIWNHGLHDWGWFDKQPHGEKFYNSVFKYFLRMRVNAAMPVIWTSMNNQCAEKLSKDSIDRGQHIMVEETNKYMNERLLREKIPYWDADAVLRVPDRCNHSADGVHVNMYVDLMRAKMLFNHLCDGKNNWRGSIDQFVGIPSDQIKL